MAVASTTQITGRTLTATAVLVGAALALTAWATSTDPAGSPARATRPLAAFPTIVDPTGPNSGAGRLTASRPTLVDPSGPNSGAGRSFA